MTGWVAKDHYRREEYRRVIDGQRGGTMNIGINTRDVETTNGRSRRGTRRRRRGGARGSIGRSRGKGGWKARGGSEID